MFWSLGNRETIANNFEIFFRLLCPICLLTYMEMESSSSSPGVRRSSGSKDSGTVVSPALVIVDLSTEGDCGFRVPNTLQFRPKGTMPPVPEASAWTLDYLASVAGNDSIDT